MESKKIGVILIILALLVGLLLWTLASQLRADATTCQPSPECAQFEGMMSILHVVIGVTSFLLALGIYILFFYKGEEEILRRLEEEKERQLQEERLAIMLTALDKSEQAVLKAIAAQEGIEQNTLRLRTGLSRSKVSEIVQSFERKGLVVRERKGKTYTIILRGRL